MPSKKQNHSAVTGKFVSKAEAKANPKETVAISIDTVKRQNNAKLRKIRVAANDVNFWINENSRVAKSLIEAQIKLAAILNG